MADLGEVVDQPHAFEQAAGDRIAHRHHLDQRTGARGRRKRRGPRARVGEDDGDLSARLGK
ncbi:MAG TPA: hypothetical protein VN615_13995, partial [Gaiellales bacterium]|nr:hypothetical protein [Gaiellales bacterium]